MSFENGDHEGKEEKNMCKSAMSRKITNEDEIYNDAEMPHSINDIKSKSSQYDVLQMKEVQAYEIIDEDMRDKSSPIAASKVFKPKFHLLKQPKKIRPAITKKRKLPGVYSLTLQFSDTCHCDNDVRIETRDKAKGIAQNQCPTPTNSPSSPSTIEDDAINCIYCHLEEDIIISQFDESLDESLDSFASVDGFGFHSTNDEERIHEYWKFCYGDQAADVKHTESMNNVSKVKPTKSCIPIGRDGMEYDVLKSKKKVQFGPNTVFEFNPNGQPGLSMD